MSETSGTESLLDRTCWCVCGHPDSYHDEGGCHAFTGQRMEYDCSCPGFKAKPGEGSLFEGSSCPACGVPVAPDECSDPLCPTLRPGSFVTTRDELWGALVQDLPHGFIVEPGEHGDGRAYYILNRDLFAAFRAFCDAKEAASRG